MVFHLGMLRRLAEAELLERVSRISTVSGGSLVAGLVFSEAGMRWPCSLEFRKEVFPSLRNKLCSRSLQWGAARQLFQIPNIRFLLSRSNLLAAALREEWKVETRLKDLPEVPEWSINGTTAETGRRFRFKRSSLGDYSLGYANSGDYPLANAMAVSAAFPGGFGPLQLQASDFDWRKRPNWDATSAVKIESKWPRLHLYDGGVYDNLGLEPFFDGGRCISKIGDDFIIASDAGAPLEAGFPKWSANPMRLKRVADIMSEQSRALRVRTFHNYLSQGSGRGSYIYIAEGDSVFNHPDKEFASDFPTTLRRTAPSDFDRIERYAHALTSSRLALLR